MKNWTLILLLTLLAINSGCLSETSQTPIATTAPPAQTTSTPPPEHYPESPRPRAPAPTTAAPVTTMPPTEVPTQPPTVQPTIMITSIPTDVEAGSTIAISWTVNGEGLTAGHSAIHYGTESNAGVLGVDDGPGDAGYPSLTTDFASGAFRLSREFSTTIVADTAGTLYLRAHAIIDGKNYWTEEITVTVKAAPAEPTIAITSMPIEALVGPVTVSWTVTGDGLKASHSAIHYGMVSKQGSLGLVDGPGDSGYPSLTTEFASGEFSLPREFTTNLTTYGAGTLYMRAHAIIDGKNYWTEETKVKIKGSGGGGGSGGGY